MSEHSSPGNAKELKRNEVLCFDDGLLTIKMSGHGSANGWATLSFNEQQFELNDEGHQVVEIPPSELYELRDFLNRVLTERPGDTAVPAQRPASAESIARTICLSYGRDPEELSNPLEMCDAHSRPVSLWRVYEEQAEAILAAYAVSSTERESK